MHGVNSFARISRTLSDLALFASWRRSTLSGTFSPDPSAERPAAAQAGLRRKQTEAGAAKRVDAAATEQAGLERCTIRAAG